MQDRLRAPDFIGIGAQKAGTSWLYAQLRAHPQICMPRKEFQYFSTHWHKGSMWYEEHFACCPEESLCGEYSTTYLPSARAQARLSARYPEAKVLCCLRHPVARAISAYRHLVAGGKLPRGTSMSHVLLCPESLPRVASTIVPYGMYDKHLTKWLAGPNQVLVIWFDDIKQDPVGVMRRVYEFLQVDPSFVSPLLACRINRTCNPRSIWVHKKLVLRGQRLARSTLSRIWLMKPLVLARELLRLVNHKGQDLRVSPGERELLASIYEPSISQLARMVDVPRRWLE